MPKDFYVGNTDHEWFEFCKKQTQLTEVNFWQPSRQHFRALDEGGVFFFRRKAPINKIGGFGILACAGQASIETSWRDLGVSNGVPNEEDFISRVAKYKNSNAIDKQTILGFKILVHPVFLDESDWIDVPKDWSNSIVTGKGYNSDAVQARSLRKLYEAHKLDEQTHVSLCIPDGFEEPETGFRHHSNSKVRVGQSAFRMRLLSSYSNKCAVTGESVEVCLQAAHIAPYSINQNHHVSNGLLLRSDIHNLFDAKLLSFDQNYRVVLSSKLRELVAEHSEYLALEGRKIRLPKNKSHRPSAKELEKHFQEMKKLSDLSI